MTSWKGYSFSKSQQDDLQHLANLLHLFHHRNNNQHRRSIWWRHFSVLRKQLNGLVDEVTSLNEVPKTHLERTRKKIQDKDSQLQISQRLQYWQSILVSKWQRAFSQLVADQRFAILGLVLVAILAQTCRITGITAALDDLGQAQVEKVLHEFADEGWDEHSVVGMEEKSGDEDFGEVVLRETPVHDDEIPKHAATESPRTVENSSMLRKRSTQGTKPRPRKSRKSRKSGNAIDDLFNSLD